MTSDEWARFSRARQNAHGGGLWSLLERYARLRAAAGSGDLRAQDRLPEMERVIAREIGLLHAAGTRPQGDARNARSRGRPLRAAAALRLRSESPAQPTTWQTWSGPREGAAAR